MFEEVLNRLGIQETNSGIYAGSWVDKPTGEEIVSINPSNGEAIARVGTASRDDYELVVRRAEEGFSRWKLIPAPKRGELVRQFGLALREKKKDLGLLITLETGKIRSEGEGEVQEVIDICDFATGLSRQLYGLTMESERPKHRMFEQWHPLGVIGIITAFNFPAAVWGWNSAIASVCGDTLIWKPSPHSPLTAIAIQNIAHQVMRDNGFTGIFNLCIGKGVEVGEWMADDRRIPLVSATGSCQMGRNVSPRVSRRLGKSLLELGGNNGVIVTEKADLDLALRAVVFAAVGTAGQRCTTLRRLIIHESILDPFLERLVSAYRTVRIGDPWEDGVLMGPLINGQSIDRMMRTLETIKEQKGKVIYGGRRLDRPGFFVEPTIVQAASEMSIVAEETFAPILYVLPFKSFEEAVRIHNSVEQGLSSAVFTRSVMEMESFLSVSGSDCGIANVNIGTSGAEIGGAFGGEKQTGGGREAGSDSWKAYMRRQTCTINWGSELPLAQGIQFGLNP